MDVEKLRVLLEEVKQGDATIEQALDRLRSLPFDDMGFATLDMHRALRQGMPEVVFCQNKTREQVAVILARLWERHDRVMGTRATPEIASFMQSQIPEARYDATSRIIMLSRATDVLHEADVPYGLVLSAGTADLPVAEEAAQTLAFFGSRTERAYDVGVAGLHRLFDRLDLLRGADVVICVAGMEGALTSVVGGLVACPVIGVPTSVGYGASFGGVAALLSMLNSCASGVSVVNIDNGFGAGVLAHKILARVARVEQP
jgi:NCAIR mutase (PurE)-related protein